MYNEKDTHNFLFHVSSHGIIALVFLRAFSVQPSLLGPFFCSLHCCIQPSFLGIYVQPSLLHLTFFSHSSCFFVLDLFFHFLSSFFITISDFSTILQPSFLVSVHYPPCLRLSKLKPLLCWMIECQTLFIIRVICRIST